jgi:CubicO group peptidase (beta-lactamase class C family)
MMREPALDAVAGTIVADRAAPMAVCAAAYKARNGWNVGVGCAGTHWPSAPSPALPDTIFDLASVTKPVVAIAAAAESERLDLSMLLSRAVPELDGTYAAPRSLEELLSHRAGLVPHLPLYQPTRSGRPMRIHRALRLAAEARSLAAPRSEATYSDLGYLLCGAAIERQVGSPLDSWLAERLRSIGQLGLASARQWAVADRAYARRCAATECVPWRGGLVRGVVHDENAWALSGAGLSGHAGLFGTVNAVAAFGSSLLDALDGKRNAAGLPRAAVERVCARRPGGTLCMGVDRKSNAGSMAGALASNETFGHLGFTGTSIWCDPVPGITTVVLTNRVCPSRDNLGLRAMRPSIQDRLYEWASRKRAGR